MFLKDNLIGFKHLGIPVYDIKKTEAWYRTQGFKKFSDAQIDTGNGIVYINFIDCNGLIAELFQMFGKDREDTKDRKDGLVDAAVFKAPFSREVRSANGEKIIYKKNEPANAPVFDHLIQYTGGLDASCAFYSGFGMEVRRFSEDGKPCAMLTCKGGAIKLVEDKAQAGRGRGRIDHIAFDIQNIDQAFEELKNEGFKLLDEAPVLQGPVFDHGVKYFMIEGPDKEAIEFNMTL